MTQESLVKTCRLSGCNVKFTVPASAKNKEFCSQSHRQAFHAGERKKGLELLRRAEAEEGLKS